MCILILLLAFCPTVSGIRHAGKFITITSQLEKLRHATRAKSPLEEEPLEARGWQSEDILLNTLLCEQSDPHFTDKKADTLSPNATDTLRVNSCTVFTILPQLYLCIFTFHYSEFTNSQLCFKFCIYHF